jgi:hypothetical protein
MANSTPTQRADHITLVRESCQKLVCAVETLQKLSNQWTRQKLNSDFSDADFTGENEGLKKNDINHVYTTLDALNTLLAANTNEHWQNLYVFIKNVKC